MNMRPFGSSGFMVPILSTYSVLREATPTATPSLNMQTVHDSAMPSHEIPMSRDFSQRPGVRVRHLVMIQSTQSRWRWNSTNGMSVGNPTSALRGSNVHPQSEIKSAGCVR